MLRIPDRPRTAGRASAFGSEWLTAGELSACALLSTQKNTSRLRGENSMIRVMIRATATEGKRSELQQMLEAVCRGTKDGVGRELYQHAGDKGTFLFIMRWTQQKSRDGASRKRLMDLMETLACLCERTEVELHALRDVAENETASSVQTETRVVYGAPPSRSSSKTKPALGEERALRSVEAYVRIHFDEKLSVADLAAAAGVSTRTLYRIFRKHGRSPMKVLKAARLAQVRQRLLHGERQETVTRLATDSGFTHLSRFSGLYRRVYGETPSVTLRRSVGANATDDRVRQPYLGGFG